MPWQKTIFLVTLIGVAPVACGNAVVLDAVRKRGAL